MSDGEQPKKRSSRYGGLAPSSSVLDDYLRDGPAAPNGRQPSRPETAPADVEDQEPAAPDPAPTPAKAPAKGRAQRAARSQPAAADDELPPPPPAARTVYRQQFNTKIEVDLLRRWEAFIRDHQTTKQGATEAAMAEYMDRRGYTVEAHRRAQRR